jgi:ATP-dependent Lon protease
MEMIDVSGYIVEEKIEIANRHLVPKQLKNHGIELDAVTFPKETLERIIEGYTRESGVRELDKRLAQASRRIAKRIAFNETFEKTVLPEHLELLLGKTKYTQELYDGNEFAGVVTGLAWTAVGGDILYIETSLSQGKGKLTITGNLGEVMKESTVIALEIIKSRASMLELKPEIFENWNVHVHVPEGAIPKDGPSAGITMVTSIASAFTQRKVKDGIAMTGEITLRGKVLPVGGIREKILAAKRANIKEILLSAQNQKDIEDIKPEYVKGLKFHYVETIDQVLEIALLKETITNPMKFEVEQKTN